MAAIEHRTLLDSGQTAVEIASEWGARVRA
jgi:hypothetical protein